MILVVGSSGMVGSEVCRILASKGTAFRALVRETTDPAKVEKLKHLGAELVKGDVRDLASLQAACQGVEQVICTISSMPLSYQPGVNDLQTVDIDGVKNLVAAAKAAGVRHFIYTSFTMEKDFPLHDAKRAVEQAVKDSGMLYTILRPSYFMELWLSTAVGFDAANARVTVYGTGDQLIGLISAKDVAGFAVESLTNPAARNSVLALGGPESISPHQAIRLFEAASGKTFEVTQVPLEALQAQLESAPDPFQKSFAGLILCFGEGDPVDMSQLQKTFAVRLTPLKEFIAGVMATA